MPNEIEAARITAKGMIIAAIITAVASTLVFIYFNSRDDQQDRSTSRPATLASSPTPGFPISTPPREEPAPTSSTVEAAAEQLISRAETPKPPIEELPSREPTPAPTPAIDPVRAVPQDSPWRSSAVAPKGVFLLHEDFSKYEDGDQPDWGRSVYVKTGKDRRKWLVTSLDGTHTVGQDVQLPNDFYLEFDFGAQISGKSYFGETGMVYSSIYLVDEQGIKYRIKWEIDPRSHTFELPNGSKSRANLGKTSAEDQQYSMQAWRKTGTLRINKSGQVLKVLVDGQLALSGNVSGFKRFVRFEVDVYKRGENVYKSGYQKRAKYIFFTDFKVGRL